MPLSTPTVIPVPGLVASLNDLLQSKTCYAYMIGLSETDLVKVTKHLQRSLKANQYAFATVDGAISDTMTAALITDEPLSEKAIKKYSEIIEPGRIDLKETSFNSLFREWSSINFDELTLTSPLLHHNIDNEIIQAIFAMILESLRHNPHLVITNLENANG